MSLRPLPALVHATAMSVMSWGYSQLGMSPMDKFIRKQWGGHWQYLTIQGLALAWLTMGLSLIGDLFPHSRAVNISKRKLMMISLPLACTISTIYWSLIAFAPELIVPRLPSSESSTTPVSGGEPSAATDAPLARIPLSLDLALHAAPGVFLALDFFLLEKRYTWKETYSQAPAIALLYGVWYGSWVEYLGKLNNGTFPYPFLTLNPFNIRLAIYGGAVMLALLAFNFLNSAHPGRPVAGDVKVVQEEISPRRPGPDM